MNTAPAQQELDAPADADQIAVALAAAKKKSMSSRKKAVQMVDAADTMPPGPDSHQLDGDTDQQDLDAPMDADQIAMAPAAAKKKRKKKKPEEPTDIGSKWIAIATNKWFKYTIWSTVLLSMLLMIVDSPHTGPAFVTAYDDFGNRYINDPRYHEYPGSDERGESVMFSSESDWSGRNSPTGPNWRPDLLNSVEMIATVIYTFEAVVLIAANGWRVYFGSFRNVTQFVVFLAGWVKVLIYFGGGKSTGGAIAILGGLRALRPWLVLSLQEDMNDILLCLVRAIKALTSILSIMVFFFVIFGLIGMQLFPSVLKNRCIAAGLDMPVPWPLLRLCKRPGRCLAALKVVATPTCQGLGW